MGRKTNAEKMSFKKKEALLTPNQKEIIELTKSGRKDPVVFADELLGVKLHDGQKLWLWMTTRTQLDKAYELGITLKEWGNR